MATNKRDLKAFVRWDSSGRVVAGSLILRKQKPKVGKWKEIIGYECCNDVTITTTVIHPEITLLGLRLLCNGTIIGTYNANITTVDIEGVFIALNNTFGMLGTFALVDEETISLTLSLEQKKALCPTGTLSFSIIELD